MSTDDVNGTVRAPLKLSGKATVELTKLLPNNQQMTLVLHYDIPSTSQRNRYLARSTRLLSEVQAAQKAGDNDAIETTSEAMLDFRHESGLEIITDVEGAAIPKGSTAVDELKAGGADFVDALVEMVYETRQRIRPDLGKFATTSEPS